MQVYNNDSVLVKKIYLKYHYTTGHSSDPLCNLIVSLPQEKKRLFLESFGEVGTTGDTLKYAFEYNTIQAPCRVSSAQDFWGYYNGEIYNQNLIPAIQKGKYSASATLVGANRFVNPDYNQFGILKKIHLPTGGTTELIYETHNVFNDGLPAKYINVQAFLLPEHETTSNTYVDTINIYSNFDPYINNSNDGGSFVDILLGDKECVGENPQPNCAQFYVRGIDAGNSDVNFPVSNDIIAHHLKKGRYEIKASFAQEHSTEQGFFMLIKWKERDTTELNRLIGGLRVKEVIHDDGLGNTYTKKYAYRNNLTTDTSSGNFLGSLEFLKLQTFWCDGAASFFVVADNNATISNHGGSYVGYRHVYEFTDSEQQNGYSHYSFDHTNDTMVTTMPFPPPTNMSEFRGRLVELKQYRKKDNNFNLLYKERNQYTDNHIYDVGFMALKTFKTSQVDCGGLGGGDPALLYNQQLYWLVPILSTIAEKEITTYDPDNNTSLTTTQTFDYDEQNYQLAKVTTTNSKGLVQEDLTWYASDSAASDNTSTVWGTMIDKNMISIPLKKVKKVNSAVTETLVNKFDYDAGNDNVQLKEIHHGYGSTTPVKRAEFVFSASDKLLEQQMTDNVKEVYLYGYDSEYPVAKLVNTTYSTASGYITQSTLDNPSGDQALRTHLNSLRSIPGAMVTTYTYKPLVGLTSETDARGKTIYYEYDGFNRLQLIRDQDNNVLKKFEYKYKTYTHANAVWETTGTTRCKPCPANAAYTTTMQQNEERDVNSNSGTYNQTRWVDAGIPGSCVAPADWQNTATPVRCKQASGINTGEQEQEQRDMNPCSSTYNQTRWQVTGTNTTACPLPVYAKLTYENYNYSYADAVHADVVVRFYSDAACTQSVSVSGLTINLAMEGYNSSTGYINDDFSQTANGTYHIVESQAELSYDNGSAFRFKDFYLMEGTGYIVVF